MGRIKRQEDLEAARRSGRGIVCGSGADAVLHTVQCGRLDAMLEGADARPLGLYKNLAKARKSNPTIGSCGECDPDGAEICDALNRSGAFLHEGVIRELEGLGYSTRSEVPVSAAPFLSDPSAQPHAASLRVPPGAAPMRLLSKSAFLRAVAASQDGSQRRERTIDICASQSHRDSVYTAVIEAKSLDPAYVNWVFLASNGADRDYSIVTKSAKPVDDGALRLMKIPRSSADSGDIHVQRKKIRAHPGTVDASADHGMDITYDPDKGYGHQKTALHDAAKQVLEGTYGLIVEAATHQAASGMTGVLEEHYIPIIVTTANLFMCEYDPGALDRKRFAAANVDLKRVESVMYHYPHPARTRFPDQIVAARDAEQASLATRWPVAIATVEGLKNLLRSPRLFRGADAPF